jgi:hypothetical protein
MTVCDLKLVKLHGPVIVFTVPSSRSNSFS